MPRNPIDATQPNGSVAGLIDSVNPLAQAEPHDGNGHESASDSSPAPVAPVRSRRVNLLLADDHSIFLAGLTAFFEGQPGLNILGHARDGEEAVQLAGELEPDVVVLDITMPGLDGIHATRRIRTHLADARVLILSMHADAPTIRRAFNEGAHGYLLKGSSPADLVRGIRALADDETFLCPKSSSLLMGNAFDAESATPACSSFDSLTDREREVLQQIADGSSSKQIAGALHLSVKTVETHRARLMRKLDLHSVAALTKCAIREGIVTLDA